MKKRLPDRDSPPSLEASIVSFGLGILLAFFLSAHALALIEALLIIALGILLLRKNKF